MFVTGLSRSVFAKPYIRRVLKVVLAPHEMILLDMEGNLWSSGWNLLGGLGNASADTVLNSPGCVIFPEEQIKMTLASSKSNAEKLYKPDSIKIKANLTIPTAAKLTAIKYLIMDNEFDTEDINTKVRFDSLYSASPENQKGDISLMMRGKAYALPYIVADNCNVWVMAEGYTSAGSAMSPNAITFAPYAVQNIYTPINVYIKGITNDGLVLYNNKLVKKAG